MHTSFLTTSTTFSPWKNFMKWVGLREPKPSFSLQTVTPSAKCQTPVKMLQRKPLRIVRVLESGQPSTQVGRMIISGRMADVCAELDRMVACESMRN
jgi:hypothetical protein